MDSNVVLCLLGPVRQCDQTWWVRSHDVDEGGGCVVRVCHCCESDCVVSFSLESSR